MNIFDFPEKIIKCRKKEFHLKYDEKNNLYYEVDDSGHLTGKRFDSIIKFLTEENDENSEEYFDLLLDNCPDDIRQVLREKISDWVTAYYLKEEKNESI